MTVQIDISPLTTLQATEEKGALTRLTRRALVTGLSSADHTNLWDALDEIDNADFTTGSVLAEETNLILTNRSARVLPGSPSKVEVRLEYLARGTTALDGAITGGSSLKQIVTEKDFFGVQVTVEHTFPDADPDFGGQTIVQGIQAPVLYPQLTLRGAVLLNRDFPHLVEGEWVGHVNSTRWAGINAGKMMVTNVTYRLSDFSQTPKEWEFTFEFQGDPNGWQPGVVFVDPRTGKPPADLVAGVGAKSFTWYPSRDFNTIFPNTDISP